MNSLFKNPYPDSSYIMTFYHIYRYACKSTSKDIEGFESKEFVTRSLNKLKQKGELIDSISYKEKLFNGRRICLYGYLIHEAHFDSTWKSYKNLTYCLKAFTFLDSNFLEIEAKCSSSGCKGFITKMEESLNTLQIEQYKW